MTYFVDERCLNYDPNSFRNWCYADDEVWKGCVRAPAVDALLPLLQRRSASKAQISSILIRPGDHLKYIQRDGEAPMVGTRDDKSSSSSRGLALQDGGEYALIFFTRFASKGHGLVTLVDTKNNSLILNDLLYEIALDDFCTMILPCFIESATRFTFENSSDWIPSDGFGHFLQRAPVGLQSVTVHFFPTLEQNRLLVQALCANQTIQTLTIFGGIEHWNSFVAVLQEHPTLHTLELKEVRTMMMDFMEVSARVVASGNGTIKLLKLGSSALPELHCRLNIQEIELNDNRSTAIPLPPCLVTLLNCSTGPVPRILISSVAFRLERWGHLREALRKPIDSSAPAEQPVTELSLLDCTFDVGAMNDLLDVAGSVVRSLHLSLPENPNLFWCQYRDCLDPALVCARQ